MKDTPTKLGLMSHVRFWSHVQVLVPSPASEPSLYPGASGIRGMLPFLTTTEHFSSSFLQFFPKTFLLFLTLNLVALSEGKRKLTLPIQA